MSLWWRFFGARIPPMWLHQLMSLPQVIRHVLFENNDTRE
jgi:hypothetical protein